MFLRYNELCGVRPRVPRLRVAAIGAPTLASMTQKIAQSVDVGLHRVLRLAVTDPLPRLVDALNAFKPDVFNAYPSIAVLLADEQLAGRLRIAPSVISTSSELRTREMSERIERAFGVRPFDLNGTTEGLWGVECDQHDGIHLFEDWCIVENVDEHGQPVPDGEHGDRLLVTNLVNRTLPMIRFEISDVVALDRRPCGCGRTLPRLRAAHGRLEDVLRLRRTRRHGARAPDAVLDHHGRPSGARVPGPTARHPDRASPGAARRRPGRRAGTDRARGDRAAVRARSGPPRGDGRGDRLDRAIAGRQAQLVDPDRASSVACPT